MPFLLGAPFPTSVKPFDPSGLNLTLWLRAGDYDSATGVWSPTPSAGTSGNVQHVLQSEVGQPPLTDGPLYNGRKSVVSDKANATERGLNSHNCGLSNVISTSSYMLSFLINIKSETYGVTTTNENTGLFGNRWWGLYLKSGVDLVLYHEDVGGTHATVTLTGLPLNTDIFVHVTYDGSNATINAGAYGSVTGSMPISYYDSVRPLNFAYNNWSNLNPGGAPIYDGRLIEVFGAQSIVATRAQLLSHVNYFNALGLS